MPKLHNKGVAPVERPGSICSKPDCEETHYAKDRCRTHYDLERPGRGGSLLPKEVIFCPHHPADFPRRAEYKDGLCQNHHKVALRHAAGRDKLGPRPKPGVVSHQKLPAEELQARKVAKKASTPTENGVCVNGHRLTPKNTRTRLDDRYTGGKQIVCKICFREAWRKNRGLDPLGDAPVGTANKEKTNCPAGHNYARFAYIVTAPTGATSRRCKICVWHRDIQKRYSITIEEWYALLTAQSGLCTICFQQMDEPHVDHDHTCCPGDSSCGLCIRGLLCASCNNGIGRFLDDAEALLSAALYVEHPPAQDVLAVFRTNS